jgi:cell division protein DivIC
MTVNPAQPTTVLPMRSSRKSRVILIFLIALCGLFVYSYTSRLMEKAQVEAQIAEVQARIVEAKTEQEKLLKERKALDQPDFIDRVARRNFGMGRPGDKVVVLIKGPASAPVAENVSAVPSTVVSSLDVGNLPVWRQWVAFFTSETFTLSIE